MSFVQKKIIRLLYILFVFITIYLIYDCSLNGDVFCMELLLNRINTSNLQAVPIRIILLNKFRQNQWHFELDLPLSITGAHNLLSKQILKCTSMHSGSIDLPLFHRSLVHQPYTYLTIHT